MCTLQAAFRRSPSTSFAPDRQYNSVQITPHHLHVILGEGRIQAPPRHPRRRPNTRGLPTYLNGVKAPRLGCERQSKP